MARSHGGGHRIRTGRDGQGSSGTSDGAPGAGTVRGDGVRRVPACRGPHVDRVDGEHVDRASDAWRRPTGPSQRLGRRRATAPTPRARTPPKRCRASVGADRCDTARRRRRVRSCLWPRPAWLWRRLNRRQRRRGLCCGRAARWLVSRASPDGRSRLRVAAAASTTSCFGSALSSEAARAVFQSGALCGTTGLRRAARACSLAHFL